MMRNDWRRWTLGVLLAVVCGAGCKREASAPPDAGGAAVATASVVDAKPVAKVKKPLKFSDVRLKYANYSLDVTYTLTNPGTAQGRGDACLALLDDKGFIIQAQRLGNIAVKGGTDDTFEDHPFVLRSTWEQARRVLLYTAREFYCAEDDLHAASEPLQLLPTGGPAPADSPAPRWPEKLKPGELVLSDPKLWRVDEGAYSVSFTVKNLGGRRINGQTCVQGYGEVEAMSKEKASTLAAAMGEFSLAPGVTETLTERISFDDARNWDEVITLDLFLDARGCESKPAAAPARLRFEKSAVLQASDEEESQLDESDAGEETTEADEIEDEPSEEVTDMDESDAYEPEVEFPQAPSTPDEETAD
ncbi:hypothetical protein JYJ95_35865 [Corallococcus exiguus]|uniref:hypothetical protein n=1 Tax=Corallococcus exiguus TaxID=83462 RepID=UPI001A8E26C0|nr:hypothetical protein [Corallococcus exiguus]MBN8471916.1 hypothetical protein [Corallococcus exiguus]